MYSQVISAIIEVCGEEAVLSHLNGVANEKVMVATRLSIDKNGVYDDRDISTIQSI
jgi:hypothetical protein